jgi:ligand-binding sensor domain-containing protein
MDLALRDYTMAGSQRPPRNTVHAVAQTSDGYIWVGTEGGLARFNGRKFSVFRKDNGSGGLLAP